MTDIISAIQHITQEGIIGIVLIFIAAFMLVSACSWAITKYTKSKNNVANYKNKMSRIIIKDEQSK